MSGREVARPQIYEKIVYLQSVMIESAICDLLGIEKPIFQGGMAWIADARLAAAVSEAGGLGLISAVNGGVEAVRAEIRKARTLTGKPFGVNVMLAAPNAAEIADLWWRRT